MWLLNTCSWEMKEVISYKQAPPYAILSHTWGDEEVSFREWQYEPWADVERKEGLSKIKECCRQAAADGLEWVWIDTCCIDKSSSAELSEAINSMFQWYSNAVVCYAYLYDVSDDIEFNLAKSRWVTRGWTLQELIAPCEVVFFSRSWQVLGTRSNLSVHLAAVTHISEPFLIGRQSLDQASIAQRMSWVAKRTTSREEDMAYCLLGIFNVNMPLIYGEGPKAFRRLQEVLNREYPEDHSLFAWGKIVKRLSNQVDDHEQIWGSKLIGHKPDQMGKELFGLFAEGPKDFEHSGKFVRAPIATKYFQLGPKVPSVSALIGLTAHMEFPVHHYRGYAAFYLKHPPIGEQCLSRLLGFGSPRSYHLSNFTIISVYGIATNCHFRSPIVECYLYHPTMRMLG
ncbi:HET-domain-containing protein [Xylariaceae sp. AK1471]|nr:HET-domain-containing protein [Xylariaceae sp. AK1471]